MEAGTFNNKMDCTETALKDNKVDLKVVRRELQLIEALMCSTGHGSARLNLCSTLIYPFSSEGNNISGSRWLLMGLHVIFDVPLIAIS